VDKDTERKNKMHLAFYSCELELNFSAIKETSMALILKYVCSNFLETLHLWLTYTELKAGLPLFKRA
jgi:hypothetical protein